MIQVLDSQDCCIQFLHVISSGGIWIFSSTLVLSFIFLPSFYAYFFSLFTYTFSLFTYYFFFIYLSCFILIIMVKEWHVWLQNGINIGLYHVWMEDIRVAECMACIYLECVCDWNECPIIPKPGQCFVSPLDVTSMAISLRGFRATFINILVVGCLKKKKKKYSREWCGPMWLQS